MNEIIIGALARAKSLYPVQICCFAFLSNHFHLILWVDDARGDEVPGTSSGRAGLEPSGNPVPVLPLHPRSNPGRLP